MLRGALRTARYLRSWLTGRYRVREEEVRIRRGDGTVPATVVRPADEPRGPLPAWIVLHGMTRPGRDHAQLRRFVHSLVATRALVVLPEVPEWIRLELSTKATLPTVEGALELIEGLPGTEPGRTALVGFSFGSPQAIICASEPSVRDRIAGVAGFGGYCDLERTFRFQLTGVHEWDGVLQRDAPDPYGRWIVGANFLPDLEGYEAAGEVATALWTLAAEAGDRQIPARDPSLTARAAELRTRLPGAGRPLFDLFAPTEGEEPEPEEVGDLVEALARAGRRASPLLDPADHFHRVEQTVHLLHGRRDRLIPYTEALRLRDRLRAACRDRSNGTTTGDVRCTVTALFAHSRGDEWPPAGKLPGEGAAFLAALAGLLSAPEARGS